MLVLTKMSKDVDQIRNVENMHKKAPHILFNLNITVLLYFYSHNVLHIQHKQQFTPLDLLILRIYLFEYLIHSTRKCNIFVSHTLITILFKPKKGFLIIKIFRILYLIRSCQFTALKKLFWGGGTHNSIHEHCNLYTEPTQ